MAINKNHEFEELATGTSGEVIKCGIVEKNVSPERVEFLKRLLEYNRFIVVVVPSPPPKTAAAPVAKLAEGEEAPPPPPPPPPAPETFTIGVTDYTFNTINAIFGRLLKTPDGHVVTMAYWQQKEAVNDDEVPYYEKES